MEDAGEHFLIDFLIFLDAHWTETKADDLLLHGLLAVNPMLWVSSATWKLQRSKVVSFHCSFRKENGYTLVLILSLPTLRLKTWHVHVCTMNLINFIVSGMYMQRFVLLSRERERLRWIRLMIYIQVCRKQLQTACRISHHHTTSRFSIWFHAYNYFRTGSEKLNCHDWSQVSLSKVSSELVS
jgi:hypothetical protein